MILRLITAASLFLSAASLALADDHAVAAGQFADLRYKTAKGDILKLRVVPAPIQRAEGLEPGRLIFAGEPGKTYSVRGYVVNFDRKTFEEVDDTVTFAGKVNPDPGPSPDPKPNPQPDPQPDPVPPPGPLHVVVVEETGQRPTEIARQLADAAFWGGLKARGVSWRLYDKDSSEASMLGYLAHANKAGLPAVLILDASGRVWDRKRFTTVAEIEATLRRYGR